MNLEISDEAEEMISKIARYHLEKIGSDYVTAVVWFVDESVDGNPFGRPPWDWIHAQGGRSRKQTNKPQQRSSHI